MAEIQREMIPVKHSSSIELGCHFKELIHEIVTVIIVIAIINGDDMSLRKDTAQA